MHNVERSMPSAILLALMLITSAQAETGHDLNVYKAIIKKVADRYNLPPAIAEAVTQVESGFDPTKIGSVGEVGLMQVMPSTAAMLGFKGNLNKLADPETNIRLGTAYLAGAWRLAGGDLCRTLMKYRAGHGEEVMTPLSAAYCAKATLYLNTHAPSLNVLSASIGAGSLADSPEGSKFLPPLTRGLRGTAFWAVHEARIRILTARVERRWKLASHR